RPRRRRGAPRGAGGRAAAPRGRPDARRGVCKAVPHVSAAAGRLSRHRGGAGPGRPAPDTPPPLPSLPPVRPAAMRSPRPLVLGAATAAALSLLLTSAPRAQLASVKSLQKISNAGGGLSNILDTSDNFGWSAAGIGDLDGDGVRDMVVGSLQDDGNVTNSNRG